MDAVDESVERNLPMQKVVSSIPGRVKPMTYKIDTCRFLAKRSRVVREGKD